MHLPLQQLINSVDFNTPGAIIIIIIIIICNLGNVILCNRVAVVGTCVVIIIVDLIVIVT
jgi:hypothetical protein